MRQHQRSVAIPIAAAVSVLALPAAATAHVTVNPKQAPAGAYTVLDVRVPTERDDASTVKVVVKMPPGIVSASYEPV
ncbi:MAG: nuclear export factor, partial [Solirubrobacterales bacterium]|nr:nuclear export factor [Solirubrobacterales bacterium]